MYPLRKIFKKNKKRIIELVKIQGLKLLSRKIFQKIKKEFFFKYYVLKIKRLHKAKSIVKLIQFVYSCDKRFIRISQVKYEIFNLLKILEKKKPKYILEIGTSNGGTLFLFSQIARDNAIIISIDLPGGPYGGGYLEWKIPLYRSFATRKQEIFLIRGDSHNLSSLNKVRNILKGKNLDFLYIDGDHSYLGVKKDFEMYAPLVDKSGIIAIHDIVHHHTKLNCQVDKYWNEIKKKYNYTEIVKDWDQKWAGIGILTKF